MKTLRDKKFEEKEKAYKEIIEVLAKVNTKIEHLPYQVSGITEFVAYNCISAIDELRQIINIYPTYDGALYRDRPMPRKLWKKIKRC